MCSETKLIAGNIEQSGNFDFLKSILFIIQLIKDKKYLVVDDSEEHSFLIEHILLKYGARVITSHKGDDALNKYKNIRDIDTIITDLRMPGISGEELILQIRAYETSMNLSQIPIIVLTGESDPEERVLCISKYGANEFLLKPVRLNDLMDALFRVTQKQPKRKLCVFVVDDDILSTYFVQKVLADIGHFPILCKTLQEAKKELQLRDPDIILLDNSLPDGTGRDFADYLKKAGKKYPIVSISGNSVDDQKRLYEGNEVEMYYQKPLTKSQLINLMDFGKVHKNKI